MYHPDPVGALEDVRAGAPLNPTDWNGFFQDYVADLRLTEAAMSAQLCRPDSPQGQAAAAVYSRLGALATDFAHVASAYGKTIISEKFLPVDTKTVKPVEVGGIAGGEKFIAMGIMFKFARDVHDLYGGDGYAAKVAAHELRAASAYFNTGIEALNIPLATTIDFRGWRLSAFAMVPIAGESSLRYGSCDQGTTILASDPDLSTAMLAAGRQLNIAPHPVAPRGGGPQVSLCAPVDVEGHIGTDGRFYLVDLARTYPPEAPHPGNPRGSHLYMQLRPELVRRSPVALSSDAFSRMGNVDPRRYSLPVSTVTRLLRASVLPRFAADITERSEYLFSGYPARLRFLHEMHRRGVNFRHLGRLLKALAAPHQETCPPLPPRTPGHTLSYTQRNRRHWFKEEVQDQIKLVVGGHAGTRTAASVIIVEMMVRLLKDVWRNNQREVLKRAPHPGPESSRQYTVAFFNCFVPVVQPLTHLSSWKDRNDAKLSNTASQSAWEALMPALFRKYFAEELHDYAEANRLTADAVAGDVALQDSFLASIGLSGFNPFLQTERAHLLRRLAYALGLRLSPRLTDGLVSLEHRLHDSDFATDVPIVKNLDVIMYCQATTSFLRAVTTHPGSVQRLLLGESFATFRKLDTDGKTNPHMLRNFADLCFEVLIRGMPQGRPPSTLVAAGPVAAVNDDAIDLHGFDGDRLHNLYTKAHTLSPQAWFAMRLESLAVARRLVAATVAAPLLYLRGHTDRVYAVATNTDGTLVASASKDRCVRLWDTSSGECSHVLVGHEFWVRGLMFWDEAGLLVSAAEDRTLRFWARLDHPNLLPQGTAHATSTGPFWQCVLTITIPGARTKIMCVAWEEDSTTVVCGSSKGVVYGFDASALVAGLQSLRSASTDRQARSAWGMIRRIDTSRASFTLKHGASDNVVHAVATTVTDGLGQPLVVSGAADGTVQVVNTVTKHVLTFGARGNDDPAVGHTAPVSSLAILPPREARLCSFAGDTVVASGSFDGTVRLWSVGNRPPSVAVLQSFNEGVWAVDCGYWDSRGSFALFAGCSDGTVRVWAPAAVPQDLVASLTDEVVVPGGKGGKGGRGPAAPPPRSTTPTPAPTPPTMPPTMYSASSTDSYSDFSAAEPAVSAAPPSAYAEAPPRPGAAPPLAKASSTDSYTAFVPGSIDGEDPAEVSPEAAAGAGSSAAASAARVQGPTDPATPTRVLWDQVRVMHMHDADVYCVRYDTVSRTLFAGSADNTVSRVSVV